MEMQGIEPGAFHMQSERSTTEPHRTRGLSHAKRTLYHWAASP